MYEYYGVLFSLISSIITEQSEQYENKNKNQRQNEQLKPKVSFKPQIGVVTFPFDKTQD